MISCDSGFVYKRYDNLLYTISQKNGKIILKNDFFIAAYPSLRSFFFVSYEYDLAKYSHMVQLNKKSITTEFMELEYIVPWPKINFLSHVLVYIFDYYVMYGISCDLIIHMVQKFYEKDSYHEHKMLNLLYDILEEVVGSIEESKKVFYDKDERGKINFLKSFLISKQSYHKKKIELLFQKNEALL